ncbi:MAG TPA: dihydrofolate reductase family protein [Chitinophagaceae bacterium]
MRKIIVSMMVSTDGFIEDGKKQIDWHIWDREMEAYMINFFERIDLMLFGRVNWELMAGYWPTEQGKKDEPRIAERMNKLDKIVFSRTLIEANWENSTLLKELDAGFIRELKKQPGKDMVIFGGANIVNSFRKLDLIDEYQLIVNPVLLGNGTPLFGPAEERGTLKLVSATSFKCGNVILHYHK